MSDSRSILTPVFRARLRGWFARNPVSVLILMVCLLIEGALEGADAGLWGAPGWRDTAYTYGSFWASLLRGDTPVYPLQPAAMFLTYGFLHGGFWHVTLTMITLVSLGAPVAARLGQASRLKTMTLPKKHQKLVLATQEARPHPCCRRCFGPSPPLERVAGLLLL